MISLSPFFSNKETISLIPPSEDVQTDTPGVLTVPAIPGKAPAGSLSRESDICWKGNGKGSVLLPRCWPCPCSPAGKPSHARSFSAGGRARPGTSESPEDGIRARILVLPIASRYWAAQTVHQAVTTSCCSQFHLHLISIYTDFIKKHTRGRTAAGDWTLGGT